MNRLTLTMLVTMGASALLFSLYPQLDLVVSGLFYAAEAGFAGDHHPFILALYRGVPLMARAMIIGLAIAMFAYTIQRDANGARRRLQVGYLIVALALGPGLVIDVLLKDNWGRARPEDVTQFGGDKTFSAALDPTEQCDDNCSFVSGHASAGFYLASLGFLGGAAARWRWTLIAIAIGGLFGFGRITQGGHFLSDVVFSFYVTWFSSWAAWAIFDRFRWMAQPAVASPSAEVRNPA